MNSVYKFNRIGNEQKKKKKVVKGFQYLTCNLTTHWRFILFFFCFIFAFKRQNKKSIEELVFSVFFFVPKHSSQNKTADLSLVSIINKNKQQQQ